MKQYGHGARLGGKHRIGHTNTHGGKLKASTRRTKRRVSAR
jgi:hypothetical protein